MFRQIKLTLQYIGNTEDTNQIPDQAATCFHGAGINRVFVRESDETYPYDVFKGVVNLIAVPMFLC